MAPAELGNEHADSPAHQHVEKHDGDALSQVNNLLQDSKSSNKAEEEQPESQNADPSQAEENHSSDEENPPLPDEAPPDDGWQPIWDPSAQAYYFYNRFTQVSQWENPRVPEATQIPSITVDQGSYDGTEGTSVDGVQNSSPPKRSIAGGYNPAIHGDYDPNADYAQQAEEDEEFKPIEAPDPSALYTATASFNRFTGRFQNMDVHNPERHSADAKATRQLRAYFDVDAAANQHDGRSLKAERAAKKLTKAEVQAYREKRRAKKEEKRRAWLRD
jgi:hypothetical protein